MPFPYALPNLAVLGRSQQRLELKESVASVAAAAVAQAEHACARRQPRAVRKARGQQQHRQHLGRRSGDDAAWCSPGWASHTRATTTVCSRRRGSKGLFLQTRVFHIAYGCRQDAQKQEQKHEATSEGCRWHWRRCTAAARQRQLPTRSSARAARTRRVRSIKPRRRSSLSSASIWSLAFGVQPKLSTAPNRQGSPKARKRRSTHG